MEKIPFLQLSKISTLLFLIGCLYYQCTSDRVFIHTEILDRYPKYLEERDGSRPSCFSFAFDACTGEACLVGNTHSMDLNACDNDRICETRTRNLNYFMDCIDARWLQKTHLHAPQLSRILAYVLSFLLLYIAFLFLNSFGTPQKRVYNLWALIFALIPVLTHSYAVNLGVVFRSGKLFTLVLVCLLFCLYEFYSISFKNNFKNKNHPLLILFIFLSIALLALSDEQAIILIFTFAIFTSFPYLNLRKSKVKNPYFTYTLILYAVLFFYLVFRFFLEKKLTYLFANIELRPMEGGYTDPSNLLSFQSTLGVSTLKAYVNQIRFLVGAHNQYGRDVLSLLSMIGVMVVFFRFLYKQCKENIRFGLVYISITMVWLVLTYFMAVRHEFIVLRSAYGLGYYHGVAMLCFLLFFIKKFVIQNNFLKRYPLLVLFLLCLFAAQHSYKFRASQLQVHTSIAPSSEIEAQKKFLFENDVFVRWIQSNGESKLFSKDEMKAIQENYNFTKHFIPK